MLPRAAPAMTLAMAMCAACATGCDGGGPPTPQVCSQRKAAPAFASQCGPTADFTPINQYRGALASAQEREDAVALINGSCTGTLIAAAAGPVVLTAGHCVGLGDQDLVAFNVEDNPDGDRLVTNGTVIETAAEPDYALLRLDQLPSAKPAQLTTRSSDRLAVIQHPRGAPKVIAEGDFLDECNDQIYYVDLDTLVGSSGAGVLTQGGYLVGVHTDGDCTNDGGGTNHGFTAASIVAASPYLQDGDIADR